MRIGMFATATFHGKQRRAHAPSPPVRFCTCMTAIGFTCLLGNGHFRRSEVVAGNMLPGNMQEIVSGIKPGDQVVSNALDLQNTVEQ